MRQKNNKLAVRKVPHVEVLGETQATSLPSITNGDRNKFVNIGKIPGKIEELPLQKQMTIKALFLEIGIKNLEHCEIQKNGQEAKLNDVVEPGDTVLAITKIRGGD